MNATSTAVGFAGNSGADTDWDRLTVFRVTVDTKDMVTAPVFANGRQQIPFRVEIAAEKGGKSVKLTDSQLKRITLVAYETGALLPAIVTVSSDRSLQYEYNWLVDWDELLKNSEDRKPDQVVGQVLFL